MSTQTDFRAALLDASVAPPDGLLDGFGGAAGRRFSVYRNNVAVSLTDALETSFPVLFKLLGEQNFKALAGIYLRAHPPSSPLMMQYGASLPEFLTQFEPLRSIPYLSDVARLENAIRESYHAGDTTPIDPARLNGIDPETLTQSRVLLAPSLRLIRSEWPLFDIWRFNSVDGAPKPQPIAQSVLVTRAEYDPEPYPLTHAEVETLSALMQGHTLSRAVTAGEAEDTEFDISALLGRLVSQNAIIDLHK